MTEQNALTILHTSDWHLGQKFMGKSREEEHKAFLSWLRKTIIQEGVTVLIVAGDIFDTGTPPNYALDLYYSFLGSLQGTSCKTVVIVAGNHDSIATMNAPKEVLKAINVHVIASGDEEDRIIEIRHGDTLEGIVCAVPFLRDSIVRKSVPGESYLERERALSEGIETYYRAVYDKAQQIRGSQPVPIIATGHLTTVGGKTSDSERELYIGNTMNIPGTFFAELFDYVALGHLHKHQTVGGNDHVRYSGSPIPLSFSEADDTKKVCIISFDEDIPLIDEIDIPCFRELYRVRGNSEEIIRELESIENEECWIEAEIDDDNTYEALRRIQDYADEKHLTILVKKIKKSDANIGAEEVEAVNLEEVSPLEIFMRRMEMENIEDETLKKHLVETFKTMEEKAATA